MKFMKKGTPMNPGGVDHACHVRGSWCVVKGSQTEKLAFASKTAARRTSLEALVSL